MAPKRTLPPKQPVEPASDDSDDDAPEEVTGTQAREEAIQARMQEGVVAVAVLPKIKAGAGQAGAGSFMREALYGSVYELKSVGKDGEEKYFRKPWAMTTLMFLGMSFCLPLAYYQERQARKARRESGVEDPLLEAGSESGGGSKRSALREVALLALPTAFDLVATVLMNVGLLYVTASVYQMMRGAEMLFAAAFAITFLGRRLNRFHAMGIVCCVVGISLVGTSSILSGEGSRTHVVSTQQMLMGMGLIITSQRRLPPPAVCPSHSRQYLEPPPLISC
eukprot:XP_001698907.1 predicted protein [Chlamydomonas reinhardtii]